MGQSAQNLGRQAENLAKQILQQKNHRILAQNLRTKIGEIDLLTQDKNWIVVVEVKAKSSDTFGTPQDMIDYRKKQKLLALAQEVSQHFPDFPVRIDVVAVYSINPPRLEHIENAVSAEEEQ